MTGREAIKSALEGTRKILEWFVKDFSDEDLLVRPLPNANHAAWQIGNVISGDVYFVQFEVPTAKMPELPAGFMEQHGPEGASKDTGFLTKQEYLDLFAQVRAGTIAALMSLADDDLDKPSSEKMRPFSPTVGSVFQLASDHTLMHAGQFSVIRRKLGKPILM